LAKSSSKCHGIKARIKATIKARIKLFQKKNSKARK
jgi:hypothetical protein